MAKAGANATNHLFGTPILIEHSDGTFRHPSATYPLPTTAGAGSATSAKQDEQTALLTTIDADTGNLGGIGTSTAASATTVAARSSVPAAAQPGVVPLAVLDIALTDQIGSDADTELTTFRTDTYGALWVQLAGALSPSVDSVAIGAATTNGCETHNSIDLDETEEEVKATAGTVYGMYLVNRDTAPVYVKFYNATAATVVVGTTTPKMTLEVPYSAASHLGTVFVFPPGIKFDTAICAAATTGIADADTGAPGANDVTALIFFK